MDALLRPARVVAAALLVVALAVHVATFLPLQPIDLRRYTLGAYPLILPLALLLVRAQSRRKVTIVPLAKYLTRTEKVLLAPAVAYLAITCLIVISGSDYMTAVRSASRVLSALGCAFFGIFVVMATLLLRYDSSQAAAGNA